MTQTESLPALRVERLSRKFGEFLAVDDISFEIPKGVICGFIGPNGAGKTTTMRICATLDLPSYGNAWVSGFSVLSHPREVRTKLGFMPDNFPVEPQIQVRHMLTSLAAPTSSWSGLANGNRRYRGVHGLGRPVAQKLWLSFKGMRQRAAWPPP